MPHGISSTTQVNRIFEQVTAGDVADGCAVVSVTSPGGRLLAYASVVDNLTGDPTFIPATDARVLGPLGPDPLPPPGAGQAMDAKAMMTWGLAEARACWLARGIRPPAPAPETARGRR